MTADTLPVVPLSDISWTNPLVRLILHQIGRRLTEELEAAWRDGSNAYPDDGIHRAARDDLE